MLACQFLALPHAPGYLCFVAAKLARLSGPWADLSVDCLALACDETEFTDFAPTGALAQIDATLGGQLRELAQSEKFRGKKNQAFSLTTLGQMAAKRVVLLGLGPRGESSPADLRALGGRAAKLANGFGAQQLGVLLPDSLCSDATSPSNVAQAVAEGLLLGQYRFDKYLAEDKRTPPSLTQIHVGLASGQDSELAAAFVRAENAARAICLARDLVNEPPVSMTPRHLAEVAQSVAKSSGLGITVLDAEACRAQNMGLFLAVAQGSEEPPRFVHLVHRPAQPRKRVVLIGKGVTFDSGGLSLKPNDGMLDMKTDMAGSAAVISVMAAIAAENLPIEVHALAACTENMPSGKAYRLGDVLHSKAGKTVEINNTDAEGRLTLADAITYALELKPDEIFDFATLTGACVVALGPHIAGVMSNNKALSDAWLEAARQAGEDMWPLPLPERLTDMLRSDVADMKNTGERWGGALTAGLFLKSFVGTTPWVHVDIAGPATTDKDAGHTSKGGTGFGVATILGYLRQLSHS